MSSLCPPRLATPPSESRLWTGGEQERRRNATRTTTDFPKTAKDEARAWGWRTGGRVSLKGKKTEQIREDGWEQQRITARLGGAGGDTCDSEERGQAEQGRGLLVGCGTVGDALLYERQAVRAQAD